MTDYYDEEELEDYWQTEDEPEEVFHFDDVEKLDLERLSTGQLRHLLETVSISPHNDQHVKLFKEYGPKIKKLLEDAPLRDSRKTAEHLREIADEVVGEPTTDAIEARRNMAAYHALRLHVDFGIAERRAFERLIECQTKDEMRREFTIMKAELTERRGQRASDRAANGYLKETSPRRKSDEMRRASIRDEMDAIDLSTPEGQRQWEEKRNRFKRELAV